MNNKQIPTDAQLTAYLIQQIDIELSKPLDEQDMRYIDECNECTSILVTSALSRTSPLAVIEKWGRVLLNIPYDRYNIAQSCALL